MTRRKKKEFNYELFFKKLEIQKHQNILINSDFLEFLLNQRKKKNFFDINKFLNFLIESLNSKATLFLPAYNWDFCKGKTFDPKKNRPMTGALSQSVLKRKNFIRSSNPLYSFFIFGKNAKKISQIKHNNCFSHQSIFGYLIKKKAINIFLGIDYKKAFTFVHVAEQQAKVNYRYLKKIDGKVIFKNKPKKKTVCFFVRNLKMNIKSTTISEKLDKVLIKKKILIKNKIMGIKIHKLQIKEVFDIVLDDLKKRNPGYVFPEKNL